MLRIVAKILNRVVQFYHRMTHWRKWQNRGQSCSNFFPLLFKKVLRDFWWVSKRQDSDNPRFHINYYHLVTICITSTIFSDPHLVNWESAFGIDKLPQAVGCIMHCQFSDSSLAACEPGPNSLSAWKILILIVASSCSTGDINRRISVVMQLVAFYFWLNN